jgi:hypothetical protein
MRSACNLLFTLLLVQWVSRYLTTNITYWHKNHTVYINYSRTIPAKTTETCIYVCVRPRLVCFAYVCKQKLDWLETLQFGPMCLVCKQNRHMDILAWNSPIRKTWNVRLPRIFLNRHWYMCLQDHNSKNMFLPRNFSVTAKPLKWNQDISKTGTHTHFKYDNRIKPRFTKNLETHYTPVPYPHNICRRLEAPGTKQMLGLVTPPVGRPCSQGCSKINCN